MSDKAPKKGALKNENKEKTESIKVTVKAESPKDSTYKGRTGIIIPKPMTSMATVKMMMAFSLDIDCILFYLISIFISVPYIVYILRTERNTLYTGQTQDLENRIKVHRSGKGSKYIRAFGKFEVVYSEEFTTRSGAMKREIEIKTFTKKQKEALVKPH